MKSFPQLKWRYHEWISYTDGSGNHAAEPDLFAPLPSGGIVCVEVKLTGGEYGRDQLLGLYAPLLSHLYDQPIYCLQLCKTLTAETPGPFRTLDSFLEAPEEYATYHWIGR